MSGVVMEDGTQWERCNGCGLLVNMDEMVYDGKAFGLDEDLDLCGNCMDLIEFELDLFLHMKKALTESWEHGKEVGAREAQWKMENALNKLGNSIDNLEAAIND